MNKRGFTLVELLIVVAIIGVLTTVGVPAFRRMIAKARQSEAKLNLGSLYRHEATFFAEHATYGSNLLGIGFELPKETVINAPYAIQPGLYSVGFPNGGTGASGCIGSLISQPTDPVVTEQLNSKMPNYFTRFLFVMITSQVEVADMYCAPAFVAPNGKTFTGSASGFIRSGHPTAGGNAEEYDSWTIDHTRNLLNIHVGI